MDLKKATGEEQILLNKIGTEADLYGSENGF